MTERNLVLVGGSYGIGKAIIDRLSATHSIYVASRTNEGLEGSNVTHIPFNATEDTLPLAALPEQIHSFVFCPGSIKLKPFKVLSIDTFRQDMEINYFSLVRAVKEIIPRMADGSSMLFFSTVAVAKGMPFHASIASAKGAIEGFAKSIAAEYAPKIRVNVIAPSLVDTPLAARLLGNDRKRELMAERHPLKRTGTADDIAKAAVFLLEEENNWVTGEVLAVDGGISNLNLS